MTLRSIVLAAMLALAAPATAATTIIHAGHLIAEPGKPALTDQSIIVEDGKIVAVKPGFVPGDTVVDLSKAWVFPGLIDMHTHVTGVLAPDQPIEPVFIHGYIGRPAALVLAMLPRMKALLANGFTTIRNLGDPSSTTYDLRDAIARGDVAGPRMIAIEPQIGIIGGDYDAANWGVRYDLERYVTSRGVCSGAADCVRAVREEVRRGADVIKLRQSSAAALDPAIKMVETPEEIRAIIAMAHQLDRRVAVHVVGTPDFLHLAIEAGADTIEHGPLDDESIKLMKARGTSFVPTLLAAKIVDYRFKDASEGAFKAWRAGVPIVFGTDLGIMTTDRSHEEFGLLAAAGIPAAEVLRAATVNAAAALGRSATLGSIAPGHIADIVAMDVDPLTHIDKLGVAAATVFVMKDGTVFKGGR